MAQKLVFSIALTISLFSNQLLGQVVTVVDGGTKLPLSGVVLRSESLNQTAFTNQKGVANLDGFIDASDIVIRLLGYKTIEISYAYLLQKGFRVELEKKNIELPAVQIVASKWEESLATVPQSIAVVKPEIATLSAAQTSADLLGNSGNVFIQKSQQGGGSPMIRGFAANRVLIQIDGVRMNNAIFRGGNLQNVISIDPLAIDNAEILYGPGSVMYGSDAIGGVMGFRTLPVSWAVKPGKTSLKTNALLRTSSANNEVTGHIDLAYRGYNIAYIGSFTQSSFNDLKMGSIGPNDYLRPFNVQRINGIDSQIVNPNDQVQLNSHFKQYHTMHKIGYSSANNKWNAVYTFIYSTTSNYDRYDRLIQLLNNKPRYAEWYYGPQKWMFNHLEFLKKLDAKMADKVAIHLSYQRFAESRHSRSYKANELTGRFENVGVMAASIDFLKVVKENGSMSYGLDFNHNNVASKARLLNIETFEEVGAQPRYPNGTFKTAAAYATYKTELSKQTTITAGGRFNLIGTEMLFNQAYYPFDVTDFSQTNNSVNGSIGLVHKPRANMVTRVNLSTGFRAPNFDDMGKVYDSEPGAVVVPNTKLKPEYAYSGDAGFAHELNSAFKYNIGVFYTYLDNALVRRDYTYNGLDSILYDGEMSAVQSIQNSAHSMVYGAQLGVNMALKNGLTGNFTVSYQNGSEQTEDGAISRPRHASPLFGRVGLKYVANDFATEINSLFNGGISASDLPIEEQGKAHLYAKNADGLPYAPAWSTLNMSVIYTGINHLQLVFGVDNLLDKRYRPYSSGLAAAGRNLRLTLKLVL